MELQPPSQELEIRQRDVTWQPPAISRAPLAFHQRLPGYAPSALVSAPVVAQALGVRRAWLKCESSRLGLPAFKILGASWATLRALEDRVGSLGDWQTLDDLAAALRPHLPLRLVAATDGNHGRAVARMARLLGLDATIYVPDDMVQARRDAIASEGAEVIVFDGTYDEAVARSAEDADARTLVISDTSWPGYVDVPGWVIEGYSSILWEVDDQLAQADAPNPDVVVMQIGVGALAAAVVAHYRQPERPQPQMVGVEPLRAACMLASIRAGVPTPVPGPHTSIMAGLNCGEVSMLAFPTVSSGVDVFVAIADDRAREAMRLLADAGVVAGETGAAGLGGVLELLADPATADGNRAAAGLHADAEVLFILSEGATDPEAYEAIVGRSAAAVSVTTAG